MSLDPRARSLLDMLNRIEAPILVDQPVADARHNFEKLLFAYRGDAPAVGVVRDLRIPRRELGGGPLRARLYMPEGVSPTPLPVFMWLHGGGWTLGDLAGYDVLCRSMCHQARCAVLAVDYRLAPENSFPAAVEDAWWALQWLRGEASSFELDPLRISVGGDSAGGNLAAVICHMARDAGLSLRLQVLVYPATDLTSTRPSHERYGVGLFLEEASIAWFLRNYLPAESDRADWRASPLLARNFSGLAPALVLTAQCDPLVDDARAYAERMQGAGIQVRYSEYAGMIHGFLTMARILPPANDALHEIASMLRAANHA